MAIKINGTVVIDDSLNVVNVNNVDGYDVSALGNKLGNIEANADVTDGANVGAALTGYTTESTIASDDIIPVYDTSATAWRKVTIANAIAAGPKRPEGANGCDQLRAKRVRSARLVRLEPRATQEPQAAQDQQVQTEPKGKKAKQATLVAQARQEPRGRKGEVGAKAKGTNWHKWF